MTFRELVGRIIVAGGVGYGAYYLYQTLYTEPVTRTPESRSPENPVDTTDSKSLHLDDCQRYINAESIQACIEARTDQ